MEAKSPRNKTITLTEEEKVKNLQLLNSHHIINGDIFTAIKGIESHSIDLLITDPPYNMAKNFGAGENSVNWKKMSDEDYEIWTQSWIEAIKHTLKPNASIYVCCDWKSSTAIYRVLSRHFIVRNRITWERDKGRGAKANWKNSSEDIWFATTSETYTFNTDAVRLKRKVVAPYRIDGKPKDWDESDLGNFRLSAPSNIWSDITVPYWSMSENTEHPTQKPEKLIAKLVLASSNEGDKVLDCFNGSGTTSVVAKKLGRKWLGIEVDSNYCVIAVERLKRAESNSKIQGYENGIFYERNSLNLQKNNFLKKS